MIPDPLPHLQRIFGFPDFRGVQRDVVDRVLRGERTLAVMPTGAGKSLTYQLPATMMPGTCVVVSPLIALMHDQLRAAEAVGIRAATLTSVVASRGKPRVRTPTSDVVPPTSTDMFLPLVAFGIVSSRSVVTRSAVARSDGPVVGVHMIGARVGELIGEGQLIVNWEAYPEDVASLVHAHPTQNEALGEAHLALAGKPLHAHN